MKTIKMLNMVSLLRSINIVLVLILYGNIYSQNWKFNVDLPIISHQIFSLKELDNGFSEYWSSERYIPNLRVSTSYKDVIVGFESYFRYANNENISLYTKLKDGEIEGVNIQSYSILFGYKKNFERFQISGGIGVTYNEEKFATYKDFEVSNWESWFCREENRWGLMFWSSLNYNIYKGLNMGLNLRFNPMFRPFEPKTVWPCITPHSHDRIHYFVSQLTVGYEF